jgi:RNA polymerase sigma-70 factor, ECF subfamily
MVPEEERAYREYPGPSDNSESRESHAREHIGAKRYRAAFELLLDLYQDKVFRLAWGILRNESTAQDMTQEVFMKIWKGLPGYRGGSSLSTWIYSIARNTCLTEIGRPAAGRFSSLDDPEVGMAAERIVDRQPATGAGGEPDIQVLIRRLPEKYRQVIVLFYLEERSYEEVAAMLGIPMGTVKTFLHRARRELAAMCRTAESRVSSCNAVR